MDKNSKKKELALRSSAAEYLTFVASTGGSDESFEMRYEDENIWLTQRMMAALYDVDIRTINEHIKKIYDDHELSEEATIRNFRIVQAEGGRQVNRELKHYTLQMIIAVGFKVNNPRAVQFRKWAGQIVKDHTIQGWTMDKERLKKDTCLRMNTLSVSSSTSVKFGCLNGNSIKRSRISTLQLSTTTRMQGPPVCFSRLCRTSCIMPFIATQRQS